MVAASFLSTLLLALAVAANPVERREALPQLAFTKQVDGGDIVKLDQLRVDIFKKNLFGVGASSSPADNRAVSYIAPVGVGHPPTYCKWFQHLIDGFNRLLHLQMTLSLIREGGQASADIYM